MGMYDYIGCEKPHKGIKPDWRYQTKSLDCELACYKIDADGKLWREVCDFEDRSDPSATGLNRLAGMQTAVNLRWVPLADWTGEVRFYDALECGWVEFSAYFSKGVMLHFVQVSGPKGGE